MRHRLRNYCYIMVCVLSLTFTLGKYALGSDGASKSRQLKKIVSLLEKRAKASPRGRIGVDISLARAFRRLGWKASSIVYLQSAIDRAPKRTKYFNAVMREFQQVASVFDLDYHQVAKLFPDRITVQDLDPDIRSFAYYYLGRDSFNLARYAQAVKHFSKVMVGSEYYFRSEFIMGIALHLSGQSKRALEVLNSITAKMDRRHNNKWLNNLIWINIARIHYEQKNYAEAIHQYSKVLRDSQLWLEALFEAAWAFFLMEKPNNSLGNLHTILSPFFADRLHAESYALKAVNLLRMCRYEHVKDTIGAFDLRFGVFSKQLADLIKFTKAKRGNVLKLFIGPDSKMHRAKYPKLTAVFERISEADLARRMIALIESVRAERLAVKAHFGGSASVAQMLLRGIHRFEVQKTAAVISYLDSEISAVYRDLAEQSEQMKLVRAELMLGRLDALRAKLKINTKAHSGSFIGGMQPLLLGEELEYWPFEGEYWEDELGGYVYNLASKCQ